MKVYRNYTQAELNTQYNHREFVLDADDYIVRTESESKRVRGLLEVKLDVRYGATREEKLDIFPAKKPRAPIQVFFHGGRWQMQNKSVASFPAEHFVAAGAIWIAVNFNKYPKVAIDDVVRDCRTAIAWVYRHAESFGGDPAKLHISGHSSGAHLVAMMLTTDWAGEYELPADVIKGASAISGMYDLEPVRLSNRNDILKLDMASALRNSPIHRLPAKSCPLILGVGGIETDEFRRQAHEFAAAWSARGLALDFLEPAGLNHFDTMALFGDAKGPIVKAMLAQMGLG
ncbi:MAG: alpha/beta hydrolase [Alphaproteobacteria bacterium]|nr:alpha/beta hydrolase [Alphaproteobacteria bacterium]